MASAYEWTLHASTDAQNVVWERVGDGVLVGFNRKGVGEPWSDEVAPPDVIDLYCDPPAALDPASELAALKAKVAALEVKQSVVEADVQLLKKA